MILTGLVGLLSFLLAGGDTPPTPADTVKVTTIEERLIIRVPLAPRPRLRIRWDEEKGPKCLPAEDIARAFLSGPDSVVFLMRGRQLFRAQLDSDCDGLDFYGQLYLLSNDQVCARRDTIRSRRRLAASSFHTHPVAIRPEPPASDASIPFASPIMRGT
jgi:hypothetical protein